MLVLYFMQLNCDRLHGRIAWKPCLTSLKHLTIPENALRGTRGRRYGYDTEDESNEDAPLRRLQDLVDLHPAPLKALTVLT